MCAYIVNMIWLKPHFEKSSCFHCTLRWAHSVFTTDESYQGRNWSSLGFSCFWIRTEPFWLGFWASWMKRIIAWKKKDIHVTSILSLECLSKIRSAWMLSLTDAYCNGVKLNASLPLMSAPCLRSSSITFSFSENKKKQTTDS